MYIIQDYKYLLRNTCCRLEASTNIALSNRKSFALIQSVCTPSSLYLWDRRTLYIGEYPEQNPLAPGASSFLVGIDGPIAITQYNTGGTITGNSFLIPAGVSFIGDTFGKRIAKYYLDPYNEDFARLKQTMTRKVAGIFVGNKKDLMFAAVMKKILCQKLSIQSAQSILESTVFPSAFEAPTRVTTDPRIIDTIDFIKSDPVTNHTNKMLWSGYTNPDTQFHLNYE